MMFLTRWHISKLVFHYSIHLSYSEKDSPREHVLIVDQEPPVEDFLDVRLQDLRARQLSKLLLLQHLIVLLRCGFLAEGGAVSARQVQLAEDLFHVRLLVDLSGKVVSIERVLLASRDFLELLLPLHVDHSLDHVQTLHNEALYYSLL